MKFAGNENFTLHHGDNREVLKELADDSIDAIVTDPPYELGFMGKSWDASGIAYDVAMWREALRVLKPGGHLLAFSGSRTYHRMAVAIEDAGFEIRDQIMWIYGSGFPKSLDVSKAIDKRGGEGSLLIKQIGEALRLSRESRGISKSKADEMFCNGTTNWTWFEGRPAGQRPPTPETFNRIIQEWPELKSLAEMVAEAEREVVGSKKSGIGTAFGEGEWASGQAQDVNITAPATDAAKQWQGWGTALKPAHEPIVVARKPLIGTVAANVLTYGTGGLNIDGARVEGKLEGDPNRFAKTDGGSFNAFSANAPVVRNEGRWPANVIHDGSDEVVELFPTTNPSKSGLRNPNGKKSTNAFGDYNGQPGVVGGHDDNGGSAARFFYCAKASKRDRNEGVETSNHHPTVKPTDLMRYLCRLVTPPGGTVLDPFAGSGSTGKAAIYEGFKFIGIEMTEEYLPIAKARIEYAVNNREDDLFNA